MEEKPKLPFPYVNLGVLDQKSLSEAMRDADIHLSFSFSNISQVPFQAMACGCAVVEAKAPSVEAMVENGKNCLLAEPAADSVAEAIIRLIRDAGLRRTITAAGLDFVREKTWENSCKQFESILFDSLLLREAEQQQEGSNSVLSQRKRVDHDSAHEFAAASGPDL
jgi:glycosyltransferase involved in cell wall biosynthesis